MVASESNRKLLLQSMLNNRFSRGTYVWWICFSAAYVFSVSSSAAVPSKLPPFIQPAAEKWADSVISTLTPAERITQLFMVAAWSNKDSTHIQEITKLIQDWGIGGLIFFQGGPVREALLTNFYQSQSKVPLLIGIDGEWGLPMRLDSCLRFPRQMTVSAALDDSLVYAMGTAIAHHCKRLGIHINFAPDADINNNPSNPIIGSRSFGDDREMVTRKAMLYMNALQDHGVMANGKHFPGHGNADSDSHLTLPSILQTREEMDTVELAPFKALINQGLSSIMVAHLNVPALDKTPGLPSTLSAPIIQGVLQQELGFKGLIFTDALNMKGVSAAYKPGILDRTALLAGNDVMLYSEDIHKAVEEIQSAIDSGFITQTEIDRRAKKVLMAKYWCGLNAYQPIDTSNLILDLNSPEDIALQHTLFEKSITLLANHSEVLPLKDVYQKKLAVVSVGAPKGNRFQSVLSDYLRADFYAAEKDATQNVFDALFEFLKNYDIVLLSLHGTTMKFQTGYGIPENARAFIDSVMLKYPTVFVDFGNAYTLSRFRHLDKAKAVVLAYEDFPLPQELAAEVVVGASVASSRIPINASAEFRRGQGIDASTTFRLKFSSPEEVGLSSKRFNAIDSIVDAAITAGAMPGCQVLVARSGKIIYDKAFGFHTYDSLQAVRTDDLYDIASVTKIVATGLATMKVFEQGKLDLNAPLSKYLPKLKSTNKKGLIIKEVLAHQAGLPAWIPFWKNTIDSLYTGPAIYSDIPSDVFSIRICDSLYMRNSFLDSLQQWVFKAPLGERGKYVYSDLGPILMRWAIEHITNKPFDQYLEEEFYGPLQLSRLMFRPYQKFTLDELVPTEFDREYRRRLIHGDVHDPAAAMQGGVSGNAGIFSNAFDLAVILQMLLEEGTYGGQQLLKPNTISMFTRQQFVQTKNRRGLLFDKPETEKGKASPCCSSASPLAFGHQGFTGTCVWVDPQYDLIYIFLSNRVNPDASNDKLVKMNVRTAIQQAIYDAVQNAR